MLNNGLLTCCAIVLFVLKNNDVIAYHISGFNVDDSAIANLQAKIMDRKTLKLLIYSNLSTSQTNADYYLANAKVLVDTFKVDVDYFVSKQIHF